MREMKLHDVHARTGIATSKLSMIERGLEAARADERLRIARAFGLSVRDLFPAKKVRGDA